MPQNNLQKLWYYLHLIKFLIYKINLIRCINLLIEYETTESSTRYKKSNNIIEYGSQNYAQIELIFKLNEKVYTIIKKYKITKRNILKKPSNQKVCDALDKFYNFFKFVDVSNDLDAIEIDEITNKCILIDSGIENCYFLTFLVKLDIYD